jgi:hypothetical protein
MLIKWFLISNSFYFDLLRQYESALDDLAIASKLCSTNADIKKLINKITDEMNGKCSNHSTLKANKEKEKEKEKSKKNKEEGTPQLSRNQPNNKQQQQSYLIESPPL